MFNLYLPAQTELQKVVISNGGQWTGNALYRANLTIGQSIAMKVESETGEACIGFWYKVKEVQLSKTKLEKFNFPQRIERTPRNAISELKVYPNPVFNHTQIEFELPEKGMVRLSMIDIQGKEVDLILNEDLPEGKYRVQYSPGINFSGMYTILLSAHGGRMHKNLIIVR
jgi:hypothetical protein